MQTSQDGTLELAKRISRLERQNRSWKIGGIAAIAALAFSLTAGLWAQEQVLPPGTERAFRSRTVEAEHFILKDESGHTMGEFTVTPQGPVINLYGLNGKTIWSTRPRPLAQAGSKAAQPAGE